MASSKQGEGGSNNTGSMMALGAMLFVFVAMWSYYRPYMARAVVKISVVESRAALAFSPILTDGYKAQLRDLVKRGVPLLRTQGVNAFKPMTNRDIFRVWNIPSKFLAPVFMLTALLMALHIKNTDIANRFRSRYKLDDLIKAQARFYPHLRPIMSAKIDQMDPRKGPWRVKYGYIEFALEHKLLRDGRGSLITTDKGEFKAAYFDRKRATALMVRQLGKKWNDKLEDLLPHEQAMFGVLAAMAAIDRPGMLAATREMNMTWKMNERKGKPPTFELECAKAIALAKKHWDHPKVVTVRRSHAYYLSMMSGLAAIKFNSGELCISHYIWLRPTDPLLFYTLHQQGLPQPNLEAAGPFIHYEVERRAGMAIVEPAVEKAVEGIKAALLDEGWISAQIVDGELAANQANVKDWSAKPEGFAVSA